LGWCRCRARGWRVRRRRARGRGTDAARRGAGVERGRTAAGLGRRSETSAARARCRRCRSNGPYAGFASRRSSVARGRRVACGACRGPSTTRGVRGRKAKPKAPAVTTGNNERNEHDGSRSCDYRAPAIPITGPVKTSAYETHRPAPPTDCRDRLRCQPTETREPRLIHRNQPPERRQIPHHLLQLIRCDSCWLAMSSEFVIHGNDDRVGCHKLEHLSNFGQRAHIGMTVKRRAASAA